MFDENARQQTQSHRIWLITLTVFVALIITYYFWCLLFSGSSFFSRYLFLFPCKGSTSISQQATGEGKDIQIIDSVGEIVATPEQIVQILKNDAVFVQAIKGQDGAQGLQGDRGASGSGTTKELAGMFAGNVTSDNHDDDDEQDLDFDATTGELEISNGDDINITAFVDTHDNQTLSLSSDVLSIDGGNTVDLSGFGSDEDNQIIDDFSLTGTTLSLSLEDDGTVNSTVDLSSLTHTGTTGSIFFAAADGTPTEDNANFFWDDTNNRLGIGTVTPGATLDVAGHIWQTGTGRSVFIGEGAGESDDLSNNRNVFVGFDAGNSNITGGRNVASGNSSLYSNTTGSQNTTSGYFSLYSNTIGSSNVATGDTALLSNTTGSDNTALGHRAGRYIANGISPNQTSNNSLYLGSNTKALADGDTNEIVIGYDATGIGSNSVVLGNDSIVSTILKGNVGIGDSTPDTGTSVLKLDVEGAVGATEYCDENGNNCTLATGLGGGTTLHSATNTLVSNNGGSDGAGGYTGTGAFNNFLGFNAGSSNTTGAFNNFLGFNAGSSNTTGGSNNFFGVNAGSSNTTGGSNSFFGFSAGSSNTTGAFNSFFGISAGASNTTGRFNSFLGYQAGRTNTTGLYNTAVGFRSGDNITTGSRNITLGYDIDGVSATGNDQLNIGNMIFGTGIDGTAGTISSGAIGIGDATPDTGTSVLKLDVEGAVGATEYCDENGNNCTAASALGGSNLASDLLWSGGTQSENVDGASAVAFDFDTDNAYTTTGAKLWSLNNNGTEVQSVTYTGTTNQWQHRFHGAGTGYIDIIGKTPNSMEIFSNKHVFMTASGILTLSGSKVSLGSGQPYFLNTQPGYMHFFPYRDNKIIVDNQPSDLAPYNFTIKNADAWTNAVTNLVGGHLVLGAGDGASASAGLASGGNVLLDGGIGYGTGSDGNILLQTNQTGSVGIGDATPDTGTSVLKLDVEGAVGATEYCDENGNNCTAASALGGSNLASDLLWSGGTQSENVDGASAIAFDFDTDNAYSAAGAKLLSLNNGGVEKVYVDKDGKLYGASNDVSYIDLNQGNLDILVKASRDTIIQGGTNRFVYIKPDAGAQYAVFQDGGSFDSRASLLMSGAKGGAAPAANLRISGQNAGNASTLDKSGGHTLIFGGNGYSSATGLAHGGDVLLDGGTGFGTGVDGDILLQTNKTGNVGIGTTTPGYKLDVIGDAHVSGKLTVDGLIDPTGLVLDEQATAPFTPDTGGKGQIWVTDGATQDFRFRDDAGTEYSLLGGGSNLASDLLWVGGTQSENADGASAVAFDFDTDNAYSAAGAKLLSLKNGGTEKIHVDKDGKIQGYSGNAINLNKGNLDIYMTSVRDIVLNGGSNRFVAVEGIKFLNGKITEAYGGGTSPPASFSISGQTSWVQSSDHSGGSLSLVAGNGYSGEAGLANGGNTYIDGGIGYGTGVDGDILLQTNKTGNVGIGTTTPGYKLDVIGDAHVSGKLTVDGLIDPTGLVLDEQATAPFTPDTGGKGQIWVTDGATQDFRFRDDAGTEYSLLGGGSNLASDLLWVGGTQSENADGASAVAFDFNDTTYTTAGSKLIRITNNLDEAFSVNYGGVLHLENYTNSAAVDINPYTGSMYFTSAAQQFGAGTGKSIVVDSDAQYQVNLSARVSNAAGGFSIFPLEQTADSIGAQLYLTGGAAKTSAVTNLIGGPLIMAGGAGASASAGLASGGNVLLDGGAGFGTGVDGDILLQTTQSGNVGIGTTGPATLLHIVAATDTDVLRLEDLDGVCNHNPEAGSETVTCSSDRSLKENITDADSALDDILKLHIRDYNIKASGDRMTGVIAQEVQDVLPDLVSEREDGILMVEQVSSWKLIKAIQELAENSGTAPDSTFRDIIGSIKALWEKISSIDEQIIDLLERIELLEGGGDHDAVNAEPLVGTATLKEGKTEVTVSADGVVDDQTKIFLTVRTLADDLPVLVVTDVDDGDFRVEIAQEFEEDIDFDWWAVVANNNGESVGEDEENIEEESSDGTGVSQEAVDESTENTDEADVAEETVEALEEKEEGDDTEESDVLDASVEEGEENTQEDLAEEAEDAVTEESSL